MIHPRLAVSTALVLLITVAAGGLVACGGSDAGNGPPFDQQYRALQTRYKPVGVEIVATLATAPQVSDDTLAIILRDEAQRLSELRGKLAALTPPQAAKAAYGNYLHDLTAARAGLDHLGFIAGTHDAQAARDESQALVDDLRRGRTTRIAFERAAGITKP
jgi:hypothetical protein